MLNTNVSYIPEYQDKFIEDDPLLYLLYSCPFKEAYAEVIDVYLRDMLDWTRQVSARVNDLVDTLIDNGIVYNAYEA